VKWIRAGWSKSREGLAALWTKAAAWRWGAPVARAAAVALGLVVLAAIGRSALARSTKSEGPPPDPSLLALPVPPTAPEAPAPAVAVSSPPAAVSSARDVDAGSSTDAGDTSPRGRATPDDPVYLNQATLADLRRLPGVGAKRAQAILALRDRIQHFRQIEDLLKVKGIGRASLRKLRPLVRLDLPPPLADAGGGSS
jgi:competence protein ComEA